MSVNAKNFNVKVPTKVNTRAEPGDKKAIFGSLCVLRTELCLGTWDTTRYADLFRERVNGARG